MSQVWIEIPILIISLGMYPYLLSKTYLEYKKRIFLEHQNSKIVCHETKKSNGSTFFVVQLFVSILWCIFSIMTEQWFILLTSTNNIITISVILSYL